MHSLRLRKKVRASIEKELSAKKAQAAFGGLGRLFEAAVYPYRLDVRKQRSPTKNTILSEPSDLDTHRENIKNISNFSYRSCGKRKKIVYRT